MPSDIEILAAQAMLTKAFMIELAAFMAGFSDDREAWIVSFIDRLHERIDSHEQLGGAAAPEIVHELARHAADGLGELLRA